ncbi:MAG TPA: MBOAT family O-acyltransferase [Gemmatimonadaceae bacterium]|nr:MBOAT family O-acyltransferase [Gemmatimonadaceae bacterium]
MSTSLLSPAFLVLAVAAVVLLSGLRGLPRQLAFLAINLAFVWRLFLGTAGTVSTLLFAVLGYGLVQLGMRRGRAGLVGGLTLLVLLFVYMRHYELLDLFVPESLLVGVLATVGLSFLFFKIVHVVIDGYSGTLGPLDPLTYLNYCLNFTTFLMGPIQRYQDYREQWSGERLAIPLTFEAHLDAVLRMLFGFVKVYLLAGVFEAHALRPETDLLALSAGELLLQAYAFWFFLYLNFSGYCDIVIGLGSLFGVRPPENFDRPFLARNISDFWLRQHRSLTLWLTDYVFAPLYKRLLADHWLARHKLLAANAAIVVTMSVSGLWHGTTLGFLLFGLVHGLWFVIYRSWDTLLLHRLGRAGVLRLRRHPLAHAGGILLTFHATAAAFVFFQLRTDRIAAVLTHVVTP